MPEKVDYSEFLYNENKKRKQKLPEVKNYGYPDKITSNDKPITKKRKNPSKRREVIVVLAIILCFCTTLLLSDYFSNGYLLADFDTDASQVTQGQTFYAVQTGIYSDKDTASYYAQDVKKRGGAGYVFFDGLYRVVASIYPKALQAKTVAERMENTGISATVFSFTLPDVSDASISRENRAKLVEVANYPVYCYEELYLLSNAIDAGTVTKDELTARLDNLKNYLSTQKEVAQSIEFSTPALSLVSSISSAIDIIKDVPANPTSGDIRYAYTAIFVQRLG